MGILRSSVQVGNATSRDRSVQHHHLEVGLFKKLPSASKVLDQAVKYIEDLQEDFDFRYKTLQSRGEPGADEIRDRKNFARPRRRAPFCWFSADLTDRNSEKMKNEVIMLQEMLNTLDFKRKVGVCVCAGRSKI